MATHRQAPAGAEGQLLAGKWCVVTGASRGIGRCIAEALAREGAHLVLVSRNKDKLHEVAESVKKLGSGRVEVCAADLAQRDAAHTVAEFVRSVTRKQGQQAPLYALINNSGMTGAREGQGPLKGDINEWMQLLDVNLLAPIILTHELAPDMVASRDGLLVNICSVAGLEAMGHMPIYAASKFGLRGWSKSCFEALRPHNIKVVTVDPGFVATEMTAATPGADRSHMILPEDIAAAVMLAVRTSPSCCPEEVVLRPVLPVLQSPMPGA